MGISPATSGPCDEARCPEIESEPPDRCRSSRGPPRLSRSFLSPREARSSRRHRSGKLHADGPEAFGCEPQLETCCTEESVELALGSGLFRKVCQDRFLGGGDAGSSGSIHFVMLHYCS